MMQVQSLAELLPLGPATSLAPGGEVLQGQEVMMAILLGLVTSPGQDWWVTTGSTLAQAWTLYPDRQQKHPVSY